MSAHVSGGLQTGESHSLVTIMQEMRKRAEADTSHGAETRAVSWAWDSQHQDRETFHLQAPFCSDCHGTPL